MTELEDMLRKYDHLTEDGPDGHYAGCGLKSPCPANDVFEKDIIALIRAELAAAQADTARLDALEALPWAMSITYNPEHPKSDSVPSLRSQIDYCLERVKCDEA